MGLNQGFSDPYRNEGISIKKKKYVFGKCQSRSARYIWLKNLAYTAVNDNKIFTIYGTCNVIRRELLGRGWVEKYPSTQMNLSQKEELEKLLLSSLVGKHPPNFIWHVPDNNFARRIERAECGTTIENTLGKDSTWTTKQGLCSSLKHNYWFYIKDVSEVTAPRSYNAYDDSEVDHFKTDYKITACTSLLKWVLAMVGSKQSIFISSGKISVNVLVFALNRCKEYLFRKQNRDIDKSLITISPDQWDIFLKKYYQLVERQAEFRIDVDESYIKLYLGYAKFLLKEIRRYRPQLTCEGYHNIWMLKPGFDRRGRGIRMASKFAVITDILSTNKRKYVIQKYIEEPLLIHKTKFDIRQYYLVTSTYPLVIWMYEDCYLKFSSQTYNVTNYHESIHLTNNAIQRKYTNCAERHKELPTYNMWDLATFKKYLNSIGQRKAWDNIIYPGMRKAIIGTMLSCQDTITASKNRFELYGCDFMLDKKYTPWIIEINSQPDLHHTTPVTAQICPVVLSDIIKVVIDYKSDENASTGNFECIYHQPMTTPKYATDLYVRGFSLPENYFYRGSVPEPMLMLYDIDNINNINKITVDIDMRESYTIDLNQIAKNESESEGYVGDKTTSKLEKLMNKIALDHNNFIDSLSRTQSISSINKIETALKNSLTRIASAVLVCCLKQDESDKVFRKTEVEDPVEKNNLVSENAIQKIFKNYEATKQRLLVDQEAIVPVKANNNKWGKMSDTKNIVIDRGNF